MNGTSGVVRAVILVVTVGLQGQGFAEGPSGNASSPGRKVFDEWCAGCHADSPFAPGTIVLRATRGAEGAVIEQRLDLPAAYIRTLVRKGLAGMPSFRRTEISVDELDALVGYLANAGAGSAPE